MSLLSPRLQLRVAQKQILTPGLVQMVSVLALNKIELKDMINAEMVENPVLEEFEDAVPLLDDVAARDGDREREVQDGGGRGAGGAAAAAQCDAVVPSADDAAGDNWGDDFDDRDRACAAVGTYSEK